MWHGVFSTQMAKYIFRGVNNSAWQPPESGNITTLSFSYQLIVSPVLTGLIITVVFSKTIDRSGREVTRFEQRTGGTGASESTQYKNVNLKQKMNWIERRNPSGTYLLRLWHVLPLWARQRHPTHYFKPLSLFVSSNPRKPLSMTNHGPWGFCNMQIAVSTRKRSKDDGWTLFHDPGWGLSRQMVRSRHTLDRGFLWPLSSRIWETFRNRKIIFGVLRLISIMDGGWKCLVAVPRNILRIDINW
jgi:hypothetical protein